MLTALAPDLVLAVVAIVQAVFALGHRQATGLRRVVVETRVVAGLIGLGVVISLLAILAPAWAPVPVQVVLATGLALWFSLPVKGAGLGIVSTAVFTVGVVFGYGGFAHGFVRVIEPTRIAEIPPERASEVDGQTLALFKEVRCLHDQVGVSVKHGNETKVTTRVVPLVGTAWAPPQPVPAWIGVAAPPPSGTTWESVCPQEPNGLFVEALLISGDGQPGFAARNALDQHGLTQVPDAPHFNFAPAPKQVWAKRTLGRTMAVALTSCWVVHLGVVGLRSRRRSS